MYDYFSKSYIESECTIYLNENSKNIFINDKRNI